MLRIPLVWLQNPLVHCPIIGWLIGVLWWVGLLVAFVAKDGLGHLSKTLNHLVYAPFFAIPWALAGLMVGAANLPFRGYWVPIVAILGTIGGGIFSIATSPFDGWLSITMPIECIGGTFVGLVVGVTTRATWGYLKGWEDSL